MSGGWKKGNVCVVVYATHTETISAPLVTNTSQAFLENGPRRKNVQSFPNVWHILLYVLSLSLFMYRMLLLFSLPCSCKVLDLCVYVCVCVCVLSLIHI